MAAAGRTLAAGFFCLYLASALSLRLAARHEKDDYRTAARIAKAALAEGKTVWWNADLNSGLYYEVPVASQGAVETGRAFWLAHPGRAMMAEAIPPDVIVASEFELRDLLRQGAKNPGLADMAGQLLRSKEDLALGPDTWAARVYSQPAGFGSLRRSTLDEPQELVMLHPTIYLWRRKS